MLLKKSLQEKSPSISRVVSPPLNLSDENALATYEQSAKPQVAVFITHGMGQQVPFETLDAATEGLALAANKNGNNVKVIRARTVLIDGVKTQRAEFDMRDAEGRDVEVHVYEGYWAPITEGQVTLRDVMVFLFSAGVRGLWNWLQPFERWIFGKEVSFGQQFKASFHLLTTLGVSLSLVAINSVIAFVAATRIFQTDCLTDCAPYFSESTFAALTSVAGIYVGVCALSGGTLFLLRYSKKWIKHPGKSTGWCFFTLIGCASVFTWLVATIAAAIALLLLAAGCLLLEGIAIKWMNDLLLLIWGGLLIASWYVKKVLVQYMGDVAVYVDSHSLDRFDDMRARIKAKVFEHAKAVYSNPQYERIAMMGHSLGSVITYDTLNALINHDALHGKQLDVINRTKLLLTFGSPLDKTAFIFASQIDKATATREALAATLQPLIQAYSPFRDINWINVYSPSDIVSGKLDFYDDSKADGYSPHRAVNNVIDADAKIPLVAHIEYWNNPTLFDELYANL